MLNETFEKSEYQHFIKIAVIDNMAESHILASLLSQYGIPYRLRSFADTAYNGLFQFQKGWGELYARADDRKEVIKMLTDIRNAVQSSA
ncbi:MAG: hypothetical protein QNI92_01590 [Desulfobacterales bacterium]|nr:hypothetical protein [Desulfobacterales bacterium]MDJ0912150.1 hypothetical protein [Desulfobacterales bacterium]